MFPAPSAPPATVPAPAGEQEVAGCSLSKRPSVPQNTTCTSQRNALPWLLVFQLFHSMFSLSVTVSVSLQVCTCGVFFPVWGKKKY